MLKRLFLIAGLSAGLLATALAGAPPAEAQPYPSRPIKLVVPFAPGGGTDILARLLLPRLTETLGQQLVVENRPGAGGNIGVDLVAKAAPDGYTILMVDSAFAVNPSLFPRLPFDPWKDLTPLGLLASGPVILVAHESLPVAAVQDLVALAKAKPGMLNFASGGNGASTHLAGELFKLVAGVDMIHVPYKGTGPAMTDLVGGQVSVMFAGISSARSFVEAGKLKALAVTGQARAPALPTVPTFDEAGLPGVDSSTYWGALAPAATPREIVARLADALSGAVRDPALQGRLVDLGYVAIGSGPEGYAENLTRESAKWAGVVQRAGVKLD